MPKITIIALDGTPNVIDIPVGKSIMQAAVDLDIPGIRAECGGACACATCQVIVEPQFAAALPEPSAMEQSMLEDEDGDGTGILRLSCQLNVTEAMDGLVVQVSKTFY